MLEWFKNKQADVESNLFASICIVKAKSCCGENQFGPQCKPCALNWGHVCSGNGRCEVKRSHLVGFILGFLNCLKGVWNSYWEWEMFVQFRIHRGYV